jgi:hypothetical protein
LRFAKQNTIDENQVDMFVHMKNPQAFLKPC